MTNLRQAITGTYDRETIAELTRPVAWSGIVDGSTRREQETARAELVDEIREALADSEVRAVRVEAGEVVGYVGPHADYPRLYVVRDGEATEVQLDAERTDGYDAEITSDDAVLAYASDEAEALRLANLYDAGRIETGNVRLRQTGQVVGCLYAGEGAAE